MYLNQALLLWWWLLLLLFVCGCVCVFVVVCLFVCLFVCLLVCLCVFVFLCLFVVVLVILCMLFCFVVRLFWVKNGYLRTSTKMNKTPCFVVFFAHLRFGVFVSFLFQPPKAIETKNNFFGVPKRLLSAEISVWFHAAHFFLVFLFFFVLLELWSHLERRFRVHKTARPLFKLVFEGLKF